MDIVDMGAKIASYARELSHSRRGITVTPGIEDDVRTFAPEADSKEIIFTANAAAFADAKLKTGMAASLSTFYYSNETAAPRSFRWNEIARVTFQGKNRFQSYSPGDEVRVQLRTGQTHILSDCMNGFDCVRVQAFLSEMANYEPPQELENGQRYRLSLDEFPPDVQLSYMKILYNYAYVIDGKVEQEEMSALQSIGVRIGLPPQVRNQLRDYLFHIDRREKTGALLLRCKRQLSYGSYEILRYSLMQDALYIMEVRPGESVWYKDPFLNGLQNVLKISDEEVGNMLAAIRLHMETQKHGADLQKLKKDIDRLCKYAGELGMPVETLFCSGSVYNVDTYRGLFKRRKQGRSIEKQRALMLQAVIRNAQETTNHLVEDLNDITLKLMEAIQSGNQRDEQIRILVERMNLFQSQMRTRAQKSGTIRAELLYNALRNRLESEQLHTLSASQRELVLQCYSANTDGSYQIRDGLSAVMLNRLTRIEELRNESQ